MAISQTNLPQCGVSNKTESSMKKDRSSTETHLMSQSNSSLQSAEPNSVVHACPMVNLWKRSMSITLHSYIHSCISLLLLLLVISITYTWHQNTATEYNIHCGTKTLPRVIVSRISQHNVTTHLRCSGNFKHEPTTGYASQHIWCLSQARINWEGCSMKGVSRKNGGMGMWVADLSGWSGAQPDCQCVCLCYLPLHHKVHKKISSGTSSPG